MISSSEFRKLYSNLRLAVELDLISLDLRELDHLFSECQPYNLMLVGESEGDAQRDVRRAALIRQRLNG